MFPSDLYVHTHYINIYIHVHVSMYTRVCVHPYTLEANHHLLEFSKNKLKFQEKKDGRTCLSLLRYNCEIRHRN